MLDIDIKIAAPSQLMSDLIREAEKKAEDVIQKLKELSLTIALSESCTAGLVAALLANTNGASSVLWGSYVCYTQEAKVSMLCLDNDELLAYGLVSRETASSMAGMALKKSGADIAVSVTGIAGPDGDGRVQPGTVFIAAGSLNRGITEKEFHFEGSRNEVRFLAATAVLEEILGILSNN